MLRSTVKLGHFVMSGTLYSVSVEPGSPLFAITSTNTSVTYTIIPMECKQIVKFQESVYNKIN